MTGQEMEEYQRGTHGNCTQWHGPNKGHRSLWSGNCGEVSQWSAAHKKGLTSWKPQREGASQDTDIKKVSGQGARLCSTCKLEEQLSRRWSREVTWCVRTFAQVDKFNCARFEVQPRPTSGFSNE